MTSLISKRLRNVLKVQTGSLSENKGIEVLSRKEFSEASFNIDLAVVNTNSSIDHHNVRHAMALHAFENVEVASVVMSFC